VATQQERRAWSHVCLPIMESQHKKAHQLKFYGNVISPGDRDHVTEFHNNREDLHREGL